MEIKEIKENGQDEKGTLETRPSEFTPMKLGFFLSHSLKRDVT